MAMTQIGDARVAYRVDGRGPGLVLVHGTGGDGRGNWDGVVPHFARHWTVVRPDYSGSGATEDGGGPLTAPLLAAQVVAAARDALPAAALPFDLVGFSLGAGIAAQIAADHPDLVRSVVLLAGFASARDARLKLQFELWRDLIRSDRKALARLVLLTGFSPDYLSRLGTAAVEEAVAAIVAGNNWEGMARQVELDLSLDVGAQARRITQPTLVVGCRLDHMVPPAHARALAGLIPGARYAELDSGHLAPMEVPDAFAELAAGFLRSAGPATWPAPWQTP